MSSNSGNVPQPSNAIGPNKEIEKEIQEIIDAYTYLTLGINKKASRRAEGRAYGGIVRAGKGELVESMTKHIVLIAWGLLKGDPQRLEFKKTKIKVLINKKYIDKIKNRYVRKYLLDNLGKYFYRQKSDLHAYIDNKFVMAIECKAYTENAMMKRILVDFTLLKKANPKLKCVLLQLESQLGGDYSELGKNPLGSYSTHTLLSHFDVDLHIITLLKGERKVDEPIHKKEFFKPLTKESLENAIAIFCELLREFC